MGDRKNGNICRRTASMAAAALSLALAACSPGQGREMAEDAVIGENPAGESAPGQDTAGESAPGKDTAGESVPGQNTAGQSAPGAGTAGESAPGQEASGAAQGDSRSEVQTGVSGEASDQGKGVAEREGHSAGPALCLSLPDDESLYSNPVRSEDDMMIQILFHDENTGSDAVARASLEKEGGFSEYYVLDEEGAEKRTVSSVSGIPVEMYVRKTVENSDIHGILISWESNGVFYELWEDDARERMADAAGMAVEIAVKSMEESGVIQE